MKKYLSILLFITCFAGFLALQVAFDLSDSSARPTPVDGRVKHHYQALYKNFSFKTFKGEQIKLSELDAPVVILNFWASWCIPCLEEFPSMLALKERFNENQVFVLGVNTDTSDARKLITKAIKKYKLNFPIVSDLNGEIAMEFMVSSLPFSIIFQHGKVMEVVYGKKDYANPKLWEYFIAAQKREKKSTE